MRLTNESTRMRVMGMAATWAMVAVLLYISAAQYRDYIGLLDAVGRRGAQVAPTPLHRICPTMYADTQMWVRHSLALAHGAGPQLRYTDVDNAPFGREVHWDSAFAWAIAGAGAIRHVLFGEPLPTGVENALAWFNLPLLLGIIVLFSAGVTRRAGLGAGVLVAFAMLGNSDFYAGFAPNYVDHHGVLAAAVFGVMLGALFMGTGFHRTEPGGLPLLPQSRDQARDGAVFSAVCGAIGMWFSAATLIPAIAIVGLAGAGTIAMHGPPGNRRGVGLDPRLWRLWGTVGGLLTFGFYLLEYAPGHLGLRLEVNHPVYALGWWGGSEMIAQLAAWRIAAKGTFRPDAKRLVSAVVAVSLAPALILIAGQQVFVVFDPFVSRLSSHVAEGISLFKAVKVFGWLRVWLLAPWFVAALGLGVVALVRSDRAERPIVVFALISFAGFAVMAFAQLRWWPSASGPEICLLLIGAAAFGSSRRKFLPWAVVGATVLALAAPSVAARFVLIRSALIGRAVDKADAIQPIYRDIAAALRASQPGGDIVLLASPNASVAISYYGGFKSVGTLYWENLAGTKAAAAIFSAPGEVAARRLLRQRGITHVAMVSQDNFLEEYFNLLHPHGRTEDFEKSFGYQLLFQQQVPIWLEQIPYEVPSDVPGKVGRVQLFKVKFGSPAAESLYEAALDAVEAGRTEAAESKLNEALALEPHSAEFWLIKGHLLLARRDFAGAFTAASHAIDDAAPLQRRPLMTAEGNRFYGRGAQAQAAQLYRRALALQPDDAATENNLAWLLATSTDATVRNGAEALKLTEALVVRHKEYIYATAYAAALAEAGRFADATTIATRVLEAARAAQDATLIGKSEQRLARYRAGKPWRE